MIHCTQRRRRLRPAHLMTSNDRPAITGTPRIRVSTRIHQAGSPIGANTKIAMIITISKKLVPHRGCSREYSAARSGTSSSSASKHEIVLCSAPWYSNTRRRSGRRDSTHR